MKYSHLSLVNLLGLTVCIGCGDSGSTSQSTSSTGPGPTTFPPTSEPSSATDSETANVPTGNEGSATMSGGLTTTEPPTSTTLTSTTVDPSTSTGGTTTTGGTTAAEDSTSPIEPSTSSTTEGPKLDMGDPCGGQVVIPDKGFLWAANSSEGTISKIDTETVTEVGRYIVRPDKAGSPSRTSVSISGNVAVANRSGGVTKVYAKPESCQEFNGMPGIQTSNNNVPLPWGVEECVAWYTPFAYQSQRPVAWGPGEFNEQTCVYENEELWTAGRGGIAGIDILVLDGNDGTVKEQINVPTGPGGLQEDPYGIYGGAIDPDGNFWGSQLGFGGKLIRVNRADMTYQIWNTPDGPHWYGMTVDSDGYVFLCSQTVGRFDPVTQTWMQSAVGGYTGCMADTGDDGLLWMSNGSGVVGVNRQTLLVEKTWPAGGSYGISIDFKGFVWAVAFGSLVTKIDPNNGQTWTYNGLVGAYTYSDMTGFSLQANVMPQ